MLRRFVITGGPCTGKTSLIRELEKEYNVFDETAREVLEGMPVIYRSTFEAQYEIFKRQLRQNEEAEGIEGIVFFDRGIPDVLSFFRYHGLSIDSELLDESKKESTNYETVFIPDFVPYEQDEIRQEEEYVIKKIHDLVVETYSDLSYQVVDVPFMDVQERVDFIKRKISFDKS